MPIYAYKCDSCGFAKDVLQKMSAPLLSHCPVCGAATFKKQLTAAGFQLKGSGWYATDFKGAAAAAATGASTETVSVAADGAKPAASPVTKSDAATASVKGSGGACGSACACH
jgi:putative FmdB family regulatory protein